MVAPVLRPTSGSNVSDLGQGGPVELSFNLFRATWDNQHFEDLAEHIEGEPQITADPSRDGTWILDADMTLDGWDQLDEYLDWLAPVVTARYPDGTIRKRQLGLYIVLDAAEKRQEFTGTVNLDARDPCWVLGAQAFTGKVKIDANANKIAIAKQLIDGAALSGANDLDGNKRYVIPAADRRFKRAQERGRNTNRLELINECLTGAAYFPLWSDEIGILRSRRGNAERLRDRAPVRAWHANVPTTGSVDPRIAAIRHLPSEVVGYIDTTPGSRDQVNGILIVNDDPHGNRISIKRRSKNNRNRRGKVQGRKNTKRGGDKVREIRHPFVDDDATAQELADTLLDLLGTKNTTATISVLPDPTFIALRENILLDIRDTAGQRILDGLYYVHRVTYPLTPGRLMQIDVGAVTDIEDDDL